MNPSPIRRLLCVLTVCLNGLATPVMADNDEVAESTRRMGSSQSPKALGSDLFGDSTSFYDGSVTFSTTDVSLPGNNALPMQVTRTRTAQASEYFSGTALFSDWDMDLPYLYGVYPKANPWQVAGGKPNNRCSAGTAPISANGFTSVDYWRGDRVHLPGGGEQFLRSDLASKPAYIATDGKTTRAVTTGYMQVRCEPGAALANPASSGFAGEGFVLLAPDGTTYTFNWMTARQIKSTTYVSGYYSNGAPLYAALDRSEVRIYPTRVEDRFRNTIDYVWAGDRLQSMTASDGRRIDFGYNSGGAIATVTANGRVWSYAYNGNLQTVTLPNRTTWKYEIPRFRIEYDVEAEAKGTQGDCRTPDPWAPNGQKTQTATVTHPSGAKGTFAFLLTRRGRTQVANVCQGYRGSEPNTSNPKGKKYYGPPLFTDGFSLVSKTINGPGLKDQTWSMAYPAPQGSAANETDTSRGATKQVVLSNPDGTRNRLTYGIEYRYNEGKLMASETLDIYGNVVRSAATAYALDPDPGRIRYVAHLATGYGFDSYAITDPTPALQTTIVQEGVTYTQTVALEDLDYMARATKATRASTLGFSRIDKTEFYDVPNKWVMGQVASQTNVDTGRVTSSTTFDPDRLKPRDTYSFGLLTARRTYNADGTVATIADALGRTTRLERWYRGVPLSVTAADNTLQTFEVDYFGNVLSKTDALANKTTYRYDDVDRLTDITYPAGDPVAPAAVNIAYTQLAGAELDVPAGAWRIRRTEGSFRKSVYFDARMQPVLTEEMDTASGLARYVRQGFDAEGRVVFSGYPLTSPPVVTGTSTGPGTVTAYDALGRVVLKQATDGTKLTAKLMQTQYLSNLRVQATDAVGNRTTTSYRAFSAPAYDTPLLIEEPENRKTSYSRDLFGNVLSAQRTDAATGATLTETNVYDAYNRLCRTIRPESGDHVVAYDAASQVTWSAAGAPASGTYPASCAPEAVPLSLRVGNEYDLMGRKKKMTFPDGTGNITYGYDEVGRLKSVGNPTATWTYGYTRRDAVNVQTLTVDGLTLTDTVEYDELGHIRSEKYPDGTTVAYKPDAWGLPTAMGDWVRQTTRHANGGLASAVLGNGLNVYNNLDERQRLASQIVTSGANPGTTGTGGAGTGTGGGSPSPGTQPPPRPKPPTGPQTPFAPSEFSALDDGLTSAYNDTGMAVSAVGSNADAMASAASSTAAAGGDGNGGSSSGVNTVLSLNYGYNDGSQLLAVTDGVGTAANGWDSATYTYDGLRRLKTAKGMWGSYTYDYDALGNLKSRVGATTLAYTYDGQNRLDSISGAASRKYQYDAAGRVKNDGRYGFTWNLADQITSAPVAGVTAYAYDGNGKRVKTVLSNGAKEYAFYSLGSKLVYTKKSSTNVSTIYLDFDGRAMVEYQSNGTSTYLHNNWQGSALVATGGGGQTLWREHYDPYGQRLSGTGGKKGYTGHSYDGETKLTYMLARYYDAEVGRFLATDPIGSGDDLNVYGYVRGDPVNGTDPTGMTTWSERAGMDGIGWAGSYPGFNVTNGLSDEQILAIAINDSAGSSGASAGGGKNGSHLAKDAAPGKAQSNSQGGTVFKNMSTNALGYAMAQKVLQNESFVKAMRYLATISVAEPGKIKEWGVAYDTVNNVIGPYFTSGKSGEIEIKDIRGPNGESVDLSNPGSFGNPSWLIMHSHPPFDDGTSAGLLSNDDRIVSRHLNVPSGMLRTNDNSIDVYVPPSGLRR